MKSPFQQQLAIERLRNKYPHHVLMIIKKHPSATQLKDFEYKYIMDKSLTMGDVNFKMRKNLSLTSEASLLLFIDGKIYPPSTSLGVIDAYHASKDDGIVHVVATTENTFG